MKPLPTKTGLLLQAASLGVAALLTTPVGGAEKVKALILDGQNNHRWRLTTPVMVDILENSGRFTVEVATSPDKGGDMSAFKPSFEGYDVVVSNYNGDLWPEETREAFTAYVESGGGFVSVHAADNAFPGWIEYNTMIGVGGWGGRTEKSGPYLRWKDGKLFRDTSPGKGGGHGPRHEFLIETRDGAHPITDGLPAKWMHAEDELYDRLRGPAENVNILATAFSSPEKKGTGENEPMLMAIPYGEGRVFHTTLGHDVKAMYGVGFQETLLRGSEWAGTGKVTFPAVSAELMPEDKVVYRDPSKDGEDGIGWIPLFNGKLREGWKQKNGTATYVYDTETRSILGTTAEGSPNSFLCTTRDYGDFELEFEVMVDNRLNSGVQIRSQTKGGTPDGRVNGPQVEIEKSPGESGYVYGEGTGRGWITPKDSLQAHSHIKNGEWNHYRIVTEGAKIRTWVNGQQVSDLSDVPIYETHPEGFIGLQVHSIKKGKGPFSVRWKNLKIREN